MAAITVSPEIKGVLQLQVAPDIPIELIRKLTQMALAGQFGWEFWSGLLTVLSWMLTWATDGDGSDEINPQVFTRLQQVAGGTVQAAEDEACKALEDLANVLGIQVPQALFRRRGDAGAGDAAAAPRDRPVLRMLIEALLPLLIQWFTGGFGTPKLQQLTQG